MIRIASLSESDLRGLISRRLDLESYVQKVKEIVDHVRRHGDRALLELTERYDGVKIESVEVGPSDLRRAADEVPEDVRAAIDTVIDVVREFNERLVPKSVIHVSSPTVIEVKYVPIERVGIYVPRGYVSTAVMTIAPARAAGVDQIFVCTPPLRDGGIGPEMAYVMRRLGVSRVFRVGGAQAIAAMAFGTETVPKVDKIVGPGNVYVQTAKLLVSPYVGIDGFRGPTELVVYFDVDDVDLVARDLIAQMEHGALSIAIAVSCDERRLREVEERVSALRDERMGQFVALLADSVDQAVEFINAFAPEHLVVYSSRPKDVVRRVRSCGIVSVNAPSAYVDYVAGPSHVLPTSSSARWQGALTPLDFLKPLVIVECVRRELIEVGIKLSEIEGFRRHGESLRAIMERLVARNSSAIA